MHEWIDEQINEWMDGCLIESINEQMQDEGINQQMELWIDELIMNGWKWMGGNGNIYLIVINVNIRLSEYMV